MPGLGRSCFPRGTRHARPVESESVRRKRRAPQRGDVTAGRHARVQRRLRRPVGGARFERHFRLLQQHGIHAVRTRRPYSGDRASRGIRIPGALPRRCPAGTPELDGPGIPMATIGVGEARWRLRAVLRDARSASTGLCVQLPNCRMRPGHHGRLRQCASRERPAPARRARSSMTRRHRSYARQPRAVRSTPACSSPPTARPGCCGRRMGIAVVYRPPSTPNSSPPTDSRQPGRRIVSSARRRHGKGISSRARRWSSPAATSGCSTPPISGAPLTTGSASPAVHRSLVPAPSRWAMPGSPPPRLGSPRPGPAERNSSGSVVFVWMVHHALAPGQSGDLAQRRLYVDLIVFPPGHCLGSPRARRPRRWPKQRSTRGPLPSQPRPGLSDPAPPVGRHWSHVNDVAVMADAARAADDLAQRQVLPGGGGP